MIDRLLHSHLEPIARGCRRWQLWRGLAQCWAILAFAGLAAILLRHYTNWSSPLIFFLLVAAAIVSVGLVVRNFRRTPLDYQAVARQIEEQNPEVHALLRTAVEQAPLSPTGELNYLQQRVIEEALQHHHRSQWGRSMARRNSYARLAHWGTFLVFILVLNGLRPDFSIHGSLWAGAERSGGITVTPGDASIERGSGLVVLARFDGKLPVEATLVINPVNDNERVVPLAKNLADPVFGGGIPEVKGDLKYHVEYPTGKTREFKVTVFDFPKLERADATIKYPEYTGLPEKMVKETRRISAVEGSSVDYSFFLNKPVASATLVAKDKTTVPLTSDTNNASVYHTKFTLDQNKRYELLLVDDAGRTNRLPPEFVLEALKNRPAELKLASPRGDQRVSAIEEVTFQGETSDDFGLQSFGFAYSVAGGETKTVEIGQKSIAHEKKQFNYVLPLETLGLQPDQLVSYYLWADDRGPDGAVRRQTSDMYFAEIRPFEEIFRESQAPEPNGSQNNNENQGGERGQGGNNQRDRLADLQKEIITATWNVKRRETESKPSSKYKDDIQVVRESQDQALEQLRTMKEENQDPRLQSFIDTAEKEMEKAARNLAEAADKNTLTTLQSAIAEEQAAYQALLKLSAREFQVTRGGQRGQRGGQQQRGGQRQQRQLDQLELRQTQNRYETQRQANAQQNNTPEQREQLQVANRLKELAQRQQDLNQRLRELQASLQEARTEQERQDIRDRLKRLREEQQDMLADVDELQQRMERPENQSQMAQERQQLEQTRSEVQNAAEALNRESGVSQALASGTRAQRELQQLQEDFRKRNSSQFAEAMREMRNDARELAQKQEEAQKKLAEIADPKQKTLSETEEQRKERLDLAETLLQQRQGVTNLLTQMREVSMQSETAEPLLSEQLYNTIRQTAQDDLNKSLEQSSELVRRGFLPQATQFEEPASRKIEDLKQGVERAAENILGDGTEALRLARRELEDLKRELDAELARAGYGQGTNTNSAGGGENQLTADGRRGSGNRGDQQQQDAQARGGRQGDPANQQADAQGNRGGRGQRDGQPGRGGGNREGQPQEGQPTEQADAQGNRGGGRGLREGQRGGGGEGQPQEGQPTEQAGNQQGEGNRGGGRAQRDGQPGRGGGGGNREGQPQDGQQQLAGGGQRDGDPNAEPNRGGGRRAGGQRNGGNQTGGGGGGDIWNGGYWDPILGEGYVDWSDRLRAVEEMIDVPELRAEVMRIRDRARTMRLDFKKAEKKPDWAVVTTQISTPLAEIRNRVDEELLKRQSKDALVPLDRDPVPSKFSELVRRYYEQIGKDNE